MATTNVGTVTAPTLTGNTNQNPWWNTGTGLIGTVANAGAANTTGTGYTANNANAASAGLTNWNVDSNQRVDGQVSQIIDQNSPLMQQAETRAKQGMAGRGLLNSSMAVGAGQAALYDAALPMAQQNATTYANAANTNAGAANQNAQFNASTQQQTNLANQNAANESAQFGANATNTANLNNANFTQQTNLANAGAANAAQQQTNTIRQQAAQGDQAAQVELVKQDLTNKMQASIQNADAQTKAYLTELDGTIKSGLATIEANYKTLMQTSQSAQTMYSDIIGQISKIAADPNMDSTSKATTITALQNYLTTGMNVIGSVNGINVGSLLTFDDDVTSAVIRNNDGSLDSNGILTDSI